MTDTAAECSQALLVAAQSGDDRAFEQLVDPFRNDLHAHCYRMLGSLHDADEASQDVLFRAWRGLAGFEGRSSLRSWLYRIATNVCLTMIDQRAKRALPMDMGPASDPDDGLAEPLTESVWLEPYPDSLLTGPAGRSERRENIELAFIAALQHLPGNERAALLLREVIGFSAREVAELVDASVPAVNSALQRARRIVNEHIESDTPRSTARLIGDARLRELVDNYVDAFERGDVDGMVALLTDDVTWSMPPVPTWYRGQTAVTAFLVNGPMLVRWRHRVTAANGQPAVGCYQWDPEQEVYTAKVIDVLTLRGDRIAQVTAFIDGGMFPRFGLPAQVLD
jgi:RNA polymerase sigma-70 factor (ECF subfamily)